MSVTLDRLVAQWESASLTQRRSAVRNRPSLPLIISRGGESIGEPLVPVQLTSPYFVLGRRRSLILKMPHGMLTVGETTRQTSYAPVASSLRPRLARNLDRHQADSWR